MARFSPSLLGQARQTGLAALLLPALASAAAADNLAGELRRFLHDEAAATVHLRSYFLDRREDEPPNRAALAGGGWIGLQSGWLYDTFQIGAVGYTSQPIWAPRDSWETSDGTVLLRPGGYGFFTLGEAYASLRWNGQVFTAYRQHIDELEVNSRGDRMIPNTFEAYALRGTIAETVRYFAGYVAAMKPRDQTGFFNMAEIAGAPDVNAGMMLASLKYGDMEKLSLRLSTYVVPDILWSSYADAGGTIAIDDTLKLQLSAQLAVQGSTGANLLTDEPFSTFWAGGQATASWGPFSLWLAYTQTGSSAAWQAPYGIWIGYNKRQVLDFNRAGERASQVGAGYDFASIGLPGLTFLVSATYGADAIAPDTGQALSQNWEYDLDLLFSADKLPLPDWLKPLRLRGRVGFTHQYLGGSVTSVTEYRAVLNYELTWKGPRRR